MNSLAITSAIFALTKNILTENMIFANGDTVLLRDLHKKLDLSQSSLPTSLFNLPSQLNFAGILISYEEIQMVGWQKEVLFTISDGGIETLKISMWLNEENPIGFRFGDQDELLGRYVFAKNVHIKSFDFTDPTELQFYGEMNPPQPSMHTILLPIMSGSSFAHYEHNQKPFAINEVMSVIPKVLEGKRAVSQYPTLISPAKVTAAALESVRVYVTCIAKDIQFGKPSNAFQRFINQQNSRPNFSERATKKSITTLRRRYRNWLTSYDQTRDWIARTSNKAMIKNMQNLSI